MLEQSTKARRQSLELKEVEFATELSGQLLDFAKSMEKLYTELQAVAKILPPLTRPSMHS